jgi:hypothetical protein
MTIYSQKKIKTPTTKLAPRTAGADYPIWLVRASSYPASALRFHRTSQAAARSGDARPAARRAPRRNAIGGLTADHRVVFGRLHDRPIRMARQAAAPGESPPPARVGSAARLAAQHRHVAAPCAPNREVADRRNAPVRVTWGMPASIQCRRRRRCNRPLARPWGRDRLRRRQKCRKARGREAIPASDASFLFRAIPLSAPAPRSPPRARRGDGRSRHAGSRSACRRRGRCPCRPGPPRHGRR